jgi:hypothetical protein
MYSHKYTVLPMISLQHASRVTIVQWNFYWNTNRNWVAPKQNQHSAFATNMYSDQSSHLCSLIRIHAVRLQTLFQVEKLVANSMDPDQTGRMRRLVWIHACCKHTMLVLSWFVMVLSLRGSKIGVVRRKNCLNRLANIYKSISIWKPGYK